MTNQPPKLDWCRVRFGQDMNWWIYEISDEVHWDVDGLGILDPRQMQHIIELLESLSEYGFKPEIFENAFFTFGITRDLKNGQLELRRTYDSILDSDEPQFALPDIMDDEKGPYADFLTHITRLRVKLLNDLLDFKQNLTIEELEDDIRENQNQDYMEGRAIHFFSEITAILEYVPEGFTLDREPDDEDEAAVIDEEVDDIDDQFVDIADDDEEIERDETMRWEDDEGEEEEADEVPAAEEEEEK